MARKYWISPRSWMVTAGGIAARVGALDDICGVARGMVGTAPLGDVDGDRQERRMLEIFTEFGYAIVDADAKVVTTAGLMAVDRIQAELLGGDSVSLELYLGEVALPEKAMLSEVHSPHCTYMPGGLSLRVLHRLLSAKDHRVVVPRILFPYVYWVIGRLMRDRRGRIVASVDNHAFPCEILLDFQSATSVPYSARILCVTEFREHDARRLEILGRGIYPCCDGILLA